MQNKAQGKVVRPIADGYISSRFGNRERRNKAGVLIKEFHPGIDISSKSVRPLVVTPFAGTVAVKGWSASFGWRVWIKLQTGMYMVLAHLQSIDNTVHIGQQLNPGDFIGIMGNTGLSDAPHLHLEIRPNPYKPGNAIEPTEVIKTFNT